MKQIYVLVYLTHLTCQVTLLCTQLHFLKLYLMLRGQTVSSHCLSWELTKELIEHLLHDPPTFPFCIYATFPCFCLHLEFRMTVIPLVCQIPYLLYPQTSCLCHSSASCTSLYQLIMLCSGCHTPCSISVMPNVLHQLLQLQKLSLEILHDAQKFQAQRQELALAQGLPLTAPATFVFSTYLSFSSLGSCMSNLIEVHFHLKDIGTSLGILLKDFKVAIQDNGFEVVIHPGHIEVIFTQIQTNCKLIDAYK